MRLHKAIYGLMRSGFEWGDRADLVCRYHGWKRVRDTQEALYYYIESGMVFLIVIYVDDILAVGVQEPLLKKLHAMRLPPDRLPEEEDLRFAMDEPVLAHRFLGLEIYGPCLHDGRVVAYLSQIAYTKAIIDRFRELGNYQENFRKASTPGVSTVIEAIQTNEDEGSAGRYASIAAKMVGAVLYLARGSRPDISYVAGLLGRHVTKWTKLCDQVLVRLISYLHHSSSAVLVFKGVAAGVTQPAFPVFVLLQRH